MSFGRAKTTGSQWCREYRFDVHCLRRCVSGWWDGNGRYPHFMVEQDWYHKGLTELIEVETMHERKQLMANLSDAVIALPGGCGTLEELLEIITWKQLGLYLNPIVILNINHYYDPLLELLRNAMNENFMRPQHAKMWAVADTPEEAIRLIYAEPKWDASLRKIAAI